MSLWQRIKEAFQKPAESHPLIVERDWRDAKLTEAAAKYAKNFKCAANTLPREVLIGGKTVAKIPAGESAIREKATITRINSRTRQQ